MVWNALYQRRQSEAALGLNLGWYKAEAEMFNWVHSVDIEVSLRLTSDVALGFVVREPGPDYPNIEDKFKIILASDNDPKTDRMVSIKELMHCCENDVAFQINTPERLDELFNTFYARPTEFSEESYILSEPIAFWKAVALLTTEPKRQEIKADLEQNPSNISTWSDDLRVPENIVQALTGDRYEQEISRFIDLK